MKHLSLFSLTLFFVTLLSSAQTTRLFVAAHQDDWQLFMGIKAFESAQNSKDHTIILHLTAGDAGYKMGNDAYYKARESSALAAARFMVNAYNSGKFYGDEMQREWVKVNNQLVLKYTYKQLDVYFMRLPDGNGDGSGFTANQNKSLEKLYTRKIIDIETIDGRSTYSNKETLIGTLKTLITSIHKTDTLEIHLPDADQKRNPGDHSDHRVASLFVQDASKGFNGLSYFFYAGYHAQTLEPNLTSDEIKIKSALWGISAAELADQRHYSSWDSIHNRALDREYFRVQQPKKPSSSQR